MSEIVRVRPLLGTFVTVRARGGPRDILTSAVDRAFARVAHVQAVMSFHDSASELSLLNREAARRPVAVSPDTLAVLRLAREIYLASDGLFDSAIAPHLVEWGYLPRGSRGGADLPPSPQATARQVHGPRTRARHRAT